MKKKQTRHVALTVLGLGVGLLGAPAAFADVQFNGFGQIVVGSTLSNKRIGTDPQNPNTYVTFPTVSDYQADPSFRPESLFALQARASLSDRLSATAQIVANGGDNNDFTPKFAWAYASYQLSDEWAIKAGRQRIPFYKYSDYLQVGESYPWIRAPISVYGAPLVNYDGISLTGSYELGDWYLQPEFVYGDYSGSLSFHGQTASVSLKNISGLVLDATYNEWLNMRVGAFYLNNTFTLSALDGPLVYNSTFGQYVPVPGTTGEITLLNYLSDKFTVDVYNQFEQLAASASDPVVAATYRAEAAAAQGVGRNLATASGQIDTQNASTTFFNAAFEIDRDNFFLSGEYIYSRTPGSYFVNAKSYYASVGYHFGKLMPILLYGHETDRASNPNSPGLIPTNFFGTNTASCASVNPLTDPNTYAQCQLDSGLAAANAGAKELVSVSRVLNNFYEFGLRYDLTSNTALKFDYTYFRSGLEGVDHAHLLSAGFVFSF